MVHTVLRRRANGESVESIRPDLIIPTGYLRQDFIDSAKVALVLPRAWRRTPSTVPSEAMASNQARSPIRLPGRPSA
jgi:hypothetical protein